MVLYGLILILTSYYLIALLFNTNRRGQRLGVLGLLLAFMWGYRTIEIDKPLSIHPIEILLWALWIKSLLIKPSSRNPIPIWAFVLMIFAIYGLFVGEIYGRDILVNISYFKNFFLLFPLFIVLDRYLISEKRLSELALYFVISISIISFFAVIEYYFPSLMILFPGFFSSEAVGYIAQGFQRAAFSFWGTPTAGHIIVSALPLMLFITKYYSFFRNYMVFTTILLLNLLALYIAGNRADWLTLILLIIIYLHLYVKVLKRSWFPLLLGSIVVGITIITRFIGQSTKDRFMSGIVALQGKADYAADSSGYDRNMRIKHALQNILEHPWGTGWGGAGWVHSDFIQLTAELGVLPGIIFFSAYLNTYFSTLKLRSNTFIIQREKQNLVVLLMCFTSVGIMLLINGHYMLVQSGIPLFFIWVTLHVYKKLIYTECNKRRYNRKRQINEEIRNHSATSNI